MADDKTDSAAADGAGEAGEAEAAADAENKPKAAQAATPRVGLQSLLVRDSDMTVRPGFRNPSNKRTKLQKKKRKK